MEYALKALTQAMPDVALSNHSGGARALDWVGMDDVELALKINHPDMGIMTLPTRADIHVNLSCEKSKGIHMSRLYLFLLKGLEGNVISDDLIKDILSDIIASHDGISNQTRLLLRYEYPLMRPALVSDNQGWRYYPVALHAKFDGENLELSQRVRITYSSTCPCSAALARQHIQHNFAQQMGERKNITIDEMVAWLGSEKNISSTPHSQRSHADIEIYSAHGMASDLAHLINYLELAIKTPVQSAVKREDEQEFARLNGENPMFAEDAARILASRLDDFPNLAGYKIKVSHEESLHPHNAVATISKGKTHAAI